MNGRSTFADEDPRDPKQLESERDALLIAAVLLHQAEQELPVLRPGQPPQTVEEAAAVATARATIARGWIELTTVVGAE